MYFQYRAARAAHVTQYRATRAAHVTQYRAARAAHDTQYYFYIDLGKSIGEKFIAENCFQFLSKNYNIFFCFALIKH